MGISKKELLKLTRLWDAFRLLRLTDEEIRLTITGGYFTPLSLIETLSQYSERILAPIIPNIKDSNLPNFIKIDTEVDPGFSINAINFEGGAVFTFDHNILSVEKKTYRLHTFWSVKHQFPLSIFLIGADKEYKLLEFLCFPEKIKSSADVKRFHKLSRRINIDIFNDGQIIDWAIRMSNNWGLMRYKYLYNFSPNGNLPPNLHVWGRVAIQDNSASSG